MKKKSVWRRFSWGKTRRILHQAEIDFDGFQHYYLEGNFFSEHTTTETTSAHQQTDQQGHKWSLYFIPLSSTDLDVSRWSSCFEAGIRSSSLQLIGSIVNRQAISRSGKMSVQLCSLLLKWDSMSGILLFPGGSFPKSSFLKGDNPKGSGRSDGGKSGAG